MCRHSPIAFLMKASLLSFLMACGATVAFAQGTPLAVTYSVTDLGTLGGSSSNAFGINDNGQVVGYSLTKNDLERHAFLYSNGKMYDLGTLGGGKSEAYGINNSGQVVGNSWTAQFNTHAFLYSNGTMSDLGTLGGSNSFAWGINASGQVAGESHISNSIHAFIYTGGVMKDIGTLDGKVNTSSEGFAINSNGDVVGLNSSGNAVPSVFLYTNGVMTDLGTLGGSYSIAYGINDGGQVVGFGGKPFHAFLYSNGKMNDLGTLGGGGSEARGINLSGQVIGLAALSDGAYHPFLYDNGVMKDLTTLLDKNASKYTITAVRGINNRGWIAATGIVNNNDHALLLKPSNITQVTTEQSFFQTADQPLFGPGSSLNISYDLGTDFDVIGNLGGFVDVHTPSIFGFGIDFGEFGAQVSASSKGLAQLQLRAKADLGTVSVNYPTAITLQFPDRGAVSAGTTFPLTSLFTIDGAATMGTKPPSAKADLNAVFQAKSSFLAQAKAFGHDLINGELLPGKLRDVTANKNLFHFDAKYDGVGGNFDFDYVSGHYQLPNLTASGGPVLTAPLTLRAEATDTFLSVTGHVTDMISQIFGLPLRGSFSEGPFDTKYSLLDLQVGVNFRIQQTITFTATPHVHLDASQTVNWTDAQNLQHTGKSVDFNVGDPNISITMPGNDPITGNAPSLTLTPTYTLPNIFNNYTALLINPKLTFVPLDANVSVSLPKIGSLGSFDIKPWDFSLVNSSIPPFKLFDKDFTLGGFQPFQGASITIVGADHNAATLDGVSPAAVSMYILEEANLSSDQIDNFNKFATSATTLTFTGTHFNPDGNTTVQLSYYGTNLTLPTTILDASTLTCDVPNKILLLPGVVRFIVSNPSAAGPSNSLDFPVQFPTPILQKTGPNLWASDPNFTNVHFTMYDNPIKDTGSIYQGSLTFIPRPDYFTLLNNKFSKYVLGGDNTVKLDSVFPKFNWNAVAPMPSIYVQEVDANDTPTSPPQAITYYHEPIPSGILFGVLPMAYYDHPKLFNTWVVAPKPGGGMSNAVRNYVGALTPQIVQLIPDATQPTNAGFRIVVKGPAENPIPSNPAKTGGNFTAQSQVLWNDQPLPTYFVNSAELQADVPASLSAVGGYARIQVSTPGASAIATIIGNIESHAPDATSDVSAAVTLPVLSPVPAIVTTAPAAINTASFTFNPNQSVLQTQYNFTVQGTGFVPNSQVAWNGQFRATQFVSANQLNVALLPSDVAVAGNISLAVTNPPSPGVTPPDGGSSALVNITVSNAAPSSDGTGLHIINVLTTATTPNADGSYTLGVEGMGFCAASVGRWNGQPRATTFGDYNSLAITLTATDLAAAVQNGGKGVVTIVNPAPGGGTSAPVTVTLPPALLTGTNPVPSLAGITPSQVAAGGPDFTLTLLGNNFVIGSQVSVGGASLPATYLNSGNLSVTVPASAIATPGNVKVTVTNPAPGGGVSGSKTLSVISQPTTISFVSFPRPLVTKSNGQLIVTVTVKNSGAAPAFQVKVTSAKIGTTNGGVSPASIASIATGGTVTLTLTFPDTAAASGTAPSVVLSYTSQNAGTGTWSGRTAVIP